MSQPERSLLARLVLFMVCLSIAGTIGAGVLSVTGMHTQQQNLQVPSNSDEELDAIPSAFLPPECDSIQAKCWVEGRTNAQPCFDECKVKHKGDIIGEAFCDRWCKNHYSLPVYHDCMQRNDCAV